MRLAYTKAIKQVSELFEQPRLVAMLRRFLYAQAYPNAEDADGIPLSARTYGVIHVSPYITVPRRPASL